MASTGLGILFGAVTLKFSVPTFYLHLACDLHNETVTLVLTFDRGTYVPRQEP